MAKGRRTNRRPARRQKKGHRSQITRLPGTLAPQHMLVKLKYVNQYQKSCPTGGAVCNFNQFRLNSIWDPDYTNVSGTSCLGVAQWSGLFQRYRVYKMAYTVRLTNLSSDTMVTGGLVFQNYLDAAFSISDIMRPLSRRFELSNKEGANKAVLKGVIHLPKLAGVTPVQYKSDNTNLAGFSANPAAPNYMTILVQPSNAGVPAAVGCQVDFTYFVELISTQASPEALDVTTGLPIVPQAVFCV
ncbi:MAG: putative capsid protein [Cressdnaviricota sp.]|nr:MAG: putative capsid protein [Cressdnaviricota sp.]